jgi:transcriptional regulator with XRE-family HTH domain
MGDQDAQQQAVGSRIREARKMAGLSQGQVAQILGLHRPSVSEIEAGNRRVSAYELSALAELFDVSISWLHGSTRSDSDDPRIELAARELSKLQPEDLERLMTILRAMRRPDSKLG